MIRGLARLLRRLLVALVLFVVLLALPVLYIEAMCRPNITESDYRSILPPEAHRPESRTLTTYPEWHIVHAYDDYAKVISTGDPHDFSFARAITQFWYSVCILSKDTGSMGGIDSEYKQMVYVIGVSFTAELMFKAAYEETVGRLFALIRGPLHSPLDTVSAAQARDYARFLQQVPWYKWDFRRDIAELDLKQTDVLRDRERRFALGAEYSAKAAYARLIADAVAATGQDELTLRMIVQGITAEDLNQTEGVTMIAERPEGIEIETVRYRALTELLAKLAAQGADFVEIAGNDDIMLTVLSPQEALAGALLSLPRQGYGDTRHLLFAKVRNLAEILRTLSTTDARLEHIHDY